MRIKAARQASLSVLWIDLGSFFFPRALLRQSPSKNVSCRRCNHKLKKTKKKIGMMQLGRTGYQPAHHHSGSSATNQRCQVPWSCPLAAVVPGALWGSAYNLQGGVLKGSRSGEQSCQLVAGALEALEQIRQGPQGGAAGQEAALLQAVARDIKMATNEGQATPLLLGHRKRRWASR